MSDDFLHGNGKMDVSLDLANFYAVELLHTIFNVIDPLEKEIARLERQLKKRSLYFKNHAYLRHPRRLRVLIISSNPVEQNSLTLMLENKNHLVDQITDKASLLTLFLARKRYDVVIVSDHFKDVGLGFFALYFRKGMSKCRPRMIYLGVESGVQGFDAHLRHPFFTEEVWRLLI